MFVIPEREALTLTNDRPAYATTQKAAKGGQQLLNSLLPLGEGGRRPDEGADVVCSYTQETGGLACTNTQKIAERNAFLNDGRLACSTTQETAKGVRPTPNSFTSGSAMVSENISFCLQSAVQHDVPRHEATEPKTCNHSITQSLSHLFTSQRAAFTLAEVLITLAIIGIVAVLTLPQLVSSYNKNVAETKLRKFYANMQNAVALSEIENGDKKNWPLYNNGSLEDFYLKYFKKYLNVTKYEVENNSVIMYFADGTIFRISGNGQLAAHGNFYLDKRALENPYTGKNVFVFYWAPAQTSSEQFCEYPILNAYDNGWVPYLYWEERHWDTEKNCAQIDVPTDREEFRNVLLNQENYGCASVNGVSNGAYCTALIEMNGWKIPDDYPIKF